MCVYKNCSTSLGKYFRKNIKKEIEKLEKHKLNEMGPLNMIICYLESKGLRDIYSEQEKILMKISIFKRRH